MARPARSLRAPNTSAYAGGTVTVIATPSGEVSNVNAKNEHQLDSRAARSRAVLGGRVEDQHRGRIVDPPRRTCGNGPPIPA